MPTDLAFSFSPFKLHNRMQLSAEPAAISEESCENSTDETLTDKSALTSSEN
jgi:hypothetical protein